MVTSVDWWISVPSIFMFLLAPACITSLAVCVLSNVVVSARVKSVSAVVIAAAAVTVLSSIPPWI